MSLPRVTRAAIVMAVGRRELVVDRATSRELASRMARDERAAQSILRPRTGLVQPLGRHVA